MMNTTLANITPTNNLTGAQRYGLAQAHSDDHVINLWLHDKSANSRAAYENDIDQFLAFLGHPKLRNITLGDVQAFSDHLEDAATTTRKRKLAAVKSLFTFAHRIGYVAFNVAAAHKLPTPKNTLAERIMSESETHQLLNAPTNARDRLLLRLLYASAARVSEITGLRWRDVHERKGAVQLTIFGKGDKTRTILLGPRISAELLASRSGAQDDDPVFTTRTGKPLCPQHVWKIVRAAAQRVGIERNVSPHWLRHAHATHAKDHGAPLHVLTATLGHSSLAVTSMYLHARPDDSSSMYLDM